MQFSDVRIWAIAYFTYRRKVEKVIFFFVIDSRDKTRQSLVW